MSPEAIVISPENTYFAQTALYGHLYGMTEHTTYNQTAGNSKVSLLLALLFHRIYVPQIGMEAKVKLASDDLPDL